jgi:SulP family sulfate permease
MLAIPRAGRMLLTEFVVSPEGVIHECVTGDSPCQRMLIFGLEGEMFFGSGSALEGYLETIENRIDKAVKVLVLRLKRLRSPDAVGMHLLDQHLKRVAARGVHVVLVGVRKDIEGALKRTGITARLRAKQIFREQPIRHTSTQQGIAHAYELISDYCPTCPRRDPATRAKQLHYAV